MSGPAVDAAGPASVPFIGGWDAGVVVTSEEGPASALPSVVNVAAAAATTAGAA